MKKEKSKAGGYKRKESLKEEVLSCGLTLLNNSSDGVGRVVTLSHMFELVHVDVVDRVFLH